MDLKIFYHVLLINNWREIVSEQLIAIKQSELYDDCDDITVGVLGSLEELEELKKVFVEHGIYNAEFYHDTKTDQYEFHTLNLLKSASELLPPFHGLYFHTKGISYTDEVNKKSGKLWRDYMNHFLIYNWGDCFNALGSGYDIAAVKVIPKRNSPSGHTHVSGNFFWFNSQYIKSLKNVQFSSDRYLAEMYPCSGEPIIYTPCQYFIDYNTRGTFEELKESGGFKKYCL